MKKHCLFTMLMVMMVTFLTGCGEKVTAESLIEGALQTDYMEYELVYTIEGTDETEGYIFESTLRLDVDVQKNALLSSEKGEFTTRTELEEFDYDSESTTELCNYRSIEDGIETYYILKNDMWLSESGDASCESFLPVLTVEMFEELEVEETDTGYQVTGKIVDNTAITAFEDGTIQSALEDIGDCDLSATLIFNEEKELDSYEVVVGVEEDQVYDTRIFGEKTISSFEIVIEFLDFEGEVTIPENVINEAVSPSEVESTEEVEDVENVKDTETQGVPLGIITDNIYANASLGLGYEVPNDNWTLFSREEIDTMYNAAVVVLQDDLGNLLANSNNVVDLYVFNNSTMANINMVVENTAGAEYVYTEDMYFAAAKYNLPSMYEGYGFEDVVIEIEEVEFLGETHKCLISEYTYMSMRIYQVQVLLNVDNYQAIITSGSYTSIDEAKSVFADFYRVEK